MVPVLHHDVTGDDGDGDDVSGDGDYGASGNGHYHQCGVWWETTKVLVWSEIVNPRYLLPWSATTHCWFDARTEEGSLAFWWAI